MGSCRKCVIKARYKKCQSDSFCVRAQSKILGNGVYEMCVCKVQNVQGCFKFFKGEVQVQVI
jgi:hypothetical protein